ncbi:hypothetical protein QR680_010660 [Steinernema hermaphroditum]|uniref:Ubiquitin-like protease family profile domain-containing protein n=1 Tax=Steinernema hermaphroditum TaxID=289476 RepID=A0AA39IR51_9BILA|nr:hypothetical protein QR680_010660 [Steinernema hermaphroditum]
MIFTNTESCANEKQESTETEWIGEGHVPNRISRQLSPVKVLWVVRAPRSQKERSFPNCIATMRAVSSDPHICSVGEANIYRSDLESLTKGRWLTDAILDFAKEYCIEALDEDTKKKISVVSPVFCQMLRFCGTIEEVASLCSDFGLSASKWTLFLLNNSFDSERAYSGTHWSLLVFDPLERRFAIYDSISGDYSSRLAASQIVEAVSPVLGAPKDNLSIADAHSSKQQNSSDCGMYTIEHMAAIIQAVKNDTNVDLDHITPAYIDDRREEWKKIIVGRAASNRRI